MISSKIPRPIIGFKYHCLISHPFSLAMTREEILQISEVINGNLQFALFVPAFERSTKITVISEITNEVTERTVIPINHILQLTNANIEEIKRYLWDYCKLCLEVTSYGLRNCPEGKTNLEFNMEYFKIYNKDDVFASVILDEIVISEYTDQKKYKGNYAVIQFDSSWGDLIDIVMKDGKIVGGGQNGMWLGEFEQD